MTADEFRDRLMAIQRARKIFCETGLTNNITHAFEVYQELLAEAERDIIVTAEQLPEDSGGFVLKEDELLDCPDCGAKMYIRIFANAPPGEPMSQVVCSNQACDTLYDSDKNASDWVRFFKERREKE